MNKKGKIIFGIIILLLLIVASVGIYFFIFNDPLKISGFTYEVPQFQGQEVCNYIDDYEGDICIIATDSVVYYGTGETNDIIIMKVTKGTNEHKSVLKSNCETPNECNFIRNVFITYPSNDLQRPTYFWYYSEDEFIRLKQWGDTAKGTNSEVFTTYLKKYPPIAI